MLCALFMLTSNCKKNNDSNDPAKKVDAGKWLEIYNTSRNQVLYRAYKGSTMVENISITSKTEGSGIGKTDNFNMDSIVLILVDLAKINDMSTYKYARYKNPKHDMAAYNATLSRNSFNPDNWVVKNDSVLLYTVYDSDFK